MTPDLLAKYARPVPRYTSYPTAPHFGPEIGAEQYRAWLAALGAVGPLSLYLHIPFCRSLCWFCGCCTRVVNNDEPIDRYFDLLLGELALVARALGRRRQVGHIHLGGGTPTTLSARNLERLADALGRHFLIDAAAEFAIEIDPRVLSSEQAAVLGRIGVNRASLGVQDFNPVVQQAVNRIQPYEATAAAVDVLRANGIDRINLDLIYGLPHQSVESVVATMERALVLGPDRVALFGYAHVPWMKKHQKLLPEAALPGPEARLAQADAATKALAAQGYVPIGLDHFARPGDSLVEALKAGALQRNFQGYTTDRAGALIGLGVSAIGSLPAGYAQNTDDSRAYAEAIGRGRFATVRGIALDDDDRLRRDIIQRLMCDFEVSLEAICRCHGRDVASFAEEYEALAPLAADGIVSLEDGVLRVSEAGRPLVRAVCATFDRYLASGKGRHSAAV